MSKEPFGVLWHFKKLKNGFMLNIFTIFRFAFQADADEGGSYLQFQFGLYKLSATLQLGVD
jgi:hypothetical protein